MKLWWPRTDVRGFCYDGLALWTVGRTIPRYTIRYFHPFLFKISNLVSIICHMRYLDMVIYENRYIKIYVKFNILQRKARQIDTKCPKNRKKVWIAEFQTRNSIDKDTEKSSNTSRKVRKYLIWYTCWFFTSCVPGVCDKIGDYVQKSTKKLKNTWQNDKIGIICKQII